MIVNIDFETRSTVDLKKTGLYPYAMHPNTEILCLAYAPRGEEPELWAPGMPIPALFRRGHGKLEMHAWNASFERVIWAAILARRHGFPPMMLEQYTDTAAAAAAMALPRSLDLAARVLGVTEQKDKKGHAVMLKMTKPRKARKNEDPGEIHWNDTPELREQLYSYCKQDVRTEAALGALLRPLSSAERRIYLLDQTINDRGVPIDLELVGAAQRIARRAVGEANAELLELTGGAVATVTQAAALTSYLQEGGLELDNMRKDTVRDTLAGDEIDDHQRRVLELRSEAAKSSTAKLDTMQDATCWDGRARGLLLYHGAATGRWSGKLIQPQNLPRPALKQIERFIPRVLAGDYEGIAAEAPPLVVISGLLRSMIAAQPGHKLIAGDFAQIEARVVAWLAGQQDLIDLFAAGGKVYEEMASAIYGVPVESIGKDSHQRQIGKNTVLGAGFGMGWKTFQAQVKVQTGIDIPDEESQAAVLGYRTRFAMVPKLWWALDAAAIRAVQEPGRVTSAGVGAEIRFLKTGRFLWCVLPSKRPLCYADPEVVERVTPWGAKKPAVRFSAMNSFNHRWALAHGYGGLWTENVVQATARDLIAAAMVRLEEAGYRPILSVHDEVVGEVPEDFGSEEEFERLMKWCPAWANGLPVAAECWSGKRYRK